jgi:hypothetical protein
MASISELLVLVNPQSLASKLYIERATPQLWPIKRQEPKPIETSTSNGYATSDHLQVRLYLDGRKVKSRVMQPVGLKKGIMKSFDSVREYANGYSSYRKFAFASHKSSTHSTKLL